MNNLVATISLILTITIVYSAFKISFGEFMEKENSEEK
jgi:hypothetical protein